MSMLRVPFTRNHCRSLLSNTRAKLLMFLQCVQAKTVTSASQATSATASAVERDGEIERLLALGARRIDIGQSGAASWTVLADPEGNEFCVIRPRETLTR
jgi:hypothetical protein